MRIIKEKTIKDLLKLDKYKIAEKHLSVLINELGRDTFETPNALKDKYRNASILSNKRVVFNVKGNDFRLIVDIEYFIQIVFIVWFGTHEEYNKIDANTISYEN